MYLGMCILLCNIYTMVIVVLYANQHAKVKKYFLNILNNMKTKCLECSHSENQVLQNQKSKFVVL